MAALNRVMLIGLVGGEPEAREVNGAKVVTFSVATTEYFKDRNGEGKEQTEWHKVVAWRHTADYAERVIHKGSQIYVEGKLHTRKWTDRNGAEKYSTEINADDIKVLGRKAADTNSGTSTNNIGAYDESPF